MSIEKNKTSTLIKVLFIYKRRIREFNWKDEMKSEKEVPEFVKKVKILLYDTLLLEHDDITLTVYLGKTSKNVLLLNSLLPTVDIDNNHLKRFPETISFCNSTKFGVDIADQKARKYSVKAGSRR
ncbi:uncharacterized protein TNCV_798181 [Trichonephila clavipes]|nr:uncharacterized protein TNCV_798181 [Trichonephila clavipes]